MRTVQLILAYRAKCHALRKINGLIIEQYHRLRDYLAIVMERNHGTLAVLTPDFPIPGGPAHFQRLYICFGEIVKGFWNGCRPFIGLDACHLRNGTSGILFSAVSRDANNQMYPIAFAIAEGENGNSWSWFMELLVQSLGDVHNHHITFISDRHKGLVQTFESLLPRHEHRFCVRHLYKNLLGRVKGSELKKWVWKAAGSSTVPMFERRMEKIKGKSVRAYNYLMAVDKSLWSRCGFSFRSKVDLLTNNTCECFNNWVLDAREKPIISLIDHIRRQMMKRLEAKKQNATKFKKSICPRILEKLSTLKKDAGSYGDPIYCGDGKYEVAYKKWRFGVNLRLKTCECRMWQLSGYPCVHGMVALGCIRESTYENWVDSCYLKETYLKAYEGTLNPIPDSTHWPSTGLQIVEPPQWKRAAGRPKKARRRTLDETQEGRPNEYSRSGQVQRCRNCNSIGHKSSTCGNQTVVRVGSNNKGGRPPIHGRYSKINTDDMDRHGVGGPSVVSGRRGGRGRPRGRRGGGRVGRGQPFGYGNYQPSLD